MGEIEGGGGQARIFYQAMVAGNIGRNICKKGNKNGLCGSKV